MAAVAIVGEGEIDGLIALGFLEESSATDRYAVGAALVSHFVASQQRRLRDNPLGWPRKNTVTHDARSRAGGA
jgi:hypothetical protein